MSVINKTDKQYINLIKRIINTGIEKQDRTGVGTLSIFGRSMRFNMNDGFPLITTRKIHFKNIVHELLWFLKGDTNIKYLVDNGVNIWNDWPYQHYKKNVGNDALAQKEFIEKIKTDNKFASEWGDVGPLYGKQWVNWDSGYTYEPNGINQIKNVIDELKTNPDSRRLLVSAWNVSDLWKMRLPPCHYSFQFYSKEKNGKRYLSLLWNQRSIDAVLGFCSNAASYALLLHIAAQVTEHIPDELIFNGGDCHIYKNHIELVKEQLIRESFELPTLELNKEIKDIFMFKYDDIKLLDYKHHPKIKFEIAV